MKDTAMRVVLFLLTVFTVGVVVGMLYSVHDFEVRHSSQQHEDVVVDDGRLKDSAVMELCEYTNEKDFSECMARHGIKVKPTPWESVSPTF